MTPATALPLVSAALPKRRRPRLGFGDVAAVILVALFGVLVVLVPLLPLYDPYKQDLSAGFLEPLGVSDSGLHLMGADALGRDFLSRLALAGRVSLIIGVVAAAVSLVMGLTLGLVAGFFRGWAESLIMGLADLQLAIPRVLLLIAATAVVGPSVTNLVILLGLTSWTAYGRMARALALSLREREFVLAATTQGAGAAWNIRKHILPNVIPNMAILGSFEFGQIVVLEASLSYLGLGIQPPLPSLGLMVSEGQTYLELNPWLSVLPGLAIFMMVAAAQLLSQRFTPEGRAGVALTRSTAS